MSTIQHGSPVCSLACPYTRQKLEPILSAALRILPGLPWWTIIPILRRVVNSVGQQYSRLAKKPLSDQTSVARPPICYYLLVHPENTERAAFANHLSHILTRLQISATDIVPWILPRPPSKENVVFHIDCFDFQNRKLLPNLIRQLFSAFKYAMATDFLISV